MNQRYSPILTCITDIYGRYQPINEGKVATYIPELAKANPHLFGICITTPDGQIYQAGESEYSFTIQSISKPFVYGLALADHGVDKIMSKVGVEPTGEAFNSIVFDEANNRPYNPMVNAGAIATTALIKGKGHEQRFNRILTMFEGFAGRSLTVDESVFESERSTGHRNRAIAYLELNAGMLEGNLDEHLDLYFRQCSILVTAKDLAVMAATLANNGLNPITQQQAVNPKEVRAILSVMASCGMYDFSGEWLYRIGLPAKSGVGGGIIAVLPGQFGIGTFSPLLDARGNSVRGIKVCEELSQRFKFHLFDSHPVSQTCVSRSYTGAMVSSKRQRRMFQRDFLDKEGDKILVYELKGDLYFATLEKLTRQLQSNQTTAQFIILDGRRVGNVNSSAITLLSEIKQWCLSQEIILILTGFEQKTQVRLQGNDRTDEMFMENIDTALEWCENSLLSQANYDDKILKNQLSLEEMDIFKAFTKEEMNVIAPLFTEVSYQADDFIVREGEKADRLFLLAKGRSTVSLKLADSDQRKRLTSYIPGIAFGELALFDVNVSQRTADIIADTEVICYVLEFDKLKTLITKNPEVYIKLLQTFGTTLVNTIKRATLEIRSLSV